MFTVTDRIACNYPANTRVLSNKKFEFSLIADEIRQLTEEVKVRRHPVEDQRNRQVARGQVIFFIYEELKLIPLHC